MHARVNTHVAIAVGMAVMVAGVMAAGVVGVGREGAVRVAAGLGEGAGKEHLHIGR